MSVSSHLALSWFGAGFGVLFCFAFGSAEGALEDLLSILYTVVFRGGVCTVIYSH